MMVFLALVSLLAGHLQMAHTSSDSRTPGHLRYLSYYTDDYPRYGQNMTALGGANLGPPLTFDPAEAVRLSKQFGVPMMYTPGGPMRMDRHPPSRGQWYHFGCRINASLGPEQCLADNWREAFEEQAQGLVPLIRNRTVVGIFFGDEVSCSGNVPFVAFDKAATYFRRALTAALARARVGEDAADVGGVFYTTNECFSAFACVPPPGECGDNSAECAQCKLVYNTSLTQPPFAGYWPHVPRALDFVSMDAYVDAPNSTSADGDGAFEPRWVREFYNRRIYPKLDSSHQRVWVVPGLCGPIRDTVPPQITPRTGPYLNDSGQPHHSTILFLATAQCWVGILHCVDC